MPEESRETQATKPPRQRGRPYTIDAVMLDRLCAFLRAGVMLRDAVKAVGCPRKTFDETVKRGRGLDHRRPTPWTRAIVEGIDEAMAEARASAAIEVKRAKPERWLEADERGSWIPAANLHLSGSVGRPPEPLEIRVRYECPACKHTTDADRAFVDMLNARQQEEEAREAARPLLPAPQHPNGDGDAAA